MELFPDISQAITIRVASNDSQTTAIDKDGQQAAIKESAQAIKVINAFGDGERAVVDGEFAKCEGAIERHSALFSRDV